MKQYYADQGSERIHEILFDEALPELISKTRIFGVIQARMASTRLPGKAMMDIEGKPMIQRVIERAMESKNVNMWCLITTHHPDDDALVEIANKCGIRVYRGSEENRVGRAYMATKFHGGGYCG